MMQDGEKKLKEFMRTKTIGRDNALKYLVTMLHNKNWKRESCKGIKKVKDHGRPFEKIKGIWFVIGEF